MSKVSVAEAWVTLRPDTDKFESEAAAAINRSGDRLVSTGKKMTAAVSLPIIAGFGLATKAASDLEQSVGAVGSVFGSAKGPIEEFGKTAAKTAGLSAREVNEMAALMGAQMQGLGFDVNETATTVVDLEKRAADMAATFGGPTSDAVEAISGVLKGERDTIEKYGVSLKQADVDARVLALGLDTSTTAAKKKSEAVASLDLVMEQTSKTEGAFAREANTAAGSQARATAAMENAASTIGTKLLPMAARAAGGVADIATGFSNLPGSVQTGILAFGGMAAAAGPVLALVGNVQKLQTKLEDAGRAGQMASGAIGGLAKAGAVVGTLLAVSHALAAIDGTSSVLVGTVADLSEQTDQELVKSFEKATAGLGAFGKGGNEAERSLKAFEMIASENVGTAQRLRDALDKEGVSVTALDRVLRKEIEAQQQAKRDTELTTTAIAGQEDATTDLTAALDSLLQSTLAQFNADLAYSNQVNAVEDALKAYNEKTAEVMRSKGQDKAATEALDRAVDDAAGAILGQAAAATEAAVQQAAMTGATVTASDKARIQREELAKVAATLAPGSPLRSQLDAYIFQLASIPSKRTTTIEQVYSSRGSSSSPVVGRRALGGPVSALAPYIVGERGPELFVPGNTGKIVPNDKLAGGDVHYHLHATHRDRLNVKDEFRRLALLKPAVRTK